MSKLGVFSFQEFSEVPKFKEAANSISSIIKQANDISLTFRTPSVSPLICHWMTLIAERMEIRLNEEEKIHHIKITWACIDSVFTILEIEL